MAAASLVEAAQQAQDNLFQQWLANHLQGHLSSFCEDLLPQFPDSLPAGRPVSNWLTVMWALAEQMFPDTVASVPLVEYTLLNTAAQYMYHLCYLADQLNSQGLITNAQATAILIEYNNQFP